MSKKTKKLIQESYRNGLQAGIELCIVEATDAKTKEKALEQMTYFITLLVESKTKRLKKSLHALS